MVYEARKCYFLFLLFTASVLGIVQPCKALVISEIMFHPADTDERLEFIELYNDREVFEDISGYSFSEGIKYTFAPGTIINSDQYIVIAFDPVELETMYDIDNVYGPYTGQLSNGGEEIKLSNENGEVIISFQYNDKRPWPVSTDGAGNSLVLAKLGSDPEEASTWLPSSFIGGTPGYPDLIQIQYEPEEPNIVSLVESGHSGRYFKGYEEPSPNQFGQSTTQWTETDFDDDPHTTDWLEGINGFGYSSDSSETETVHTYLNDMQGNYSSAYARLYFTVTSEQIDTFTQLRSVVHYDDGYVLYLNGFEICRNNVNGEPPAFDVLSNSGSDYTADTQSSSSWIDLLVTGTNVLAIQGHNTSLSGSSDFVMTPKLYGVIAPVSQENGNNLKIVINEVLSNSDALAGVDWIELYNPSDATLDLSNMYLSNDSQNLLKYNIPDGTILSPGEFWTVSQGATLYDLPFGISFSGETIYLTVATDQTDPLPLSIFDAVYCEPTNADVTFGRFPDGSSYFGILSSETFNCPNSRLLVNDIVINEIMYNHGTHDDRYEYVELYNQGNDIISLGGWAFTDGIDYEFDSTVQIEAGSYIVVAKDPNFLAGVYDNLLFGFNLFGPYSGKLGDHSERIRLSYSVSQIDPDTNDVQTAMVTVDEVTYYDGGRWPTWADGQGASLELRDPLSNNDTPQAWADSDESRKNSWEYFSFTIEGSDLDYTHDLVNIFDVMLLNRGEVLLDDLELQIGDYVNNDDFEPGRVSYWRALGNHIRSFITEENSVSGSMSMHLIATGHGDPGANRINRTISSRSNDTVTFSGWAKWLKGSQYLLMRIARERSPVQPPRPSHAFELNMPMNLGTPGLQNTAFAANRGPDIREVKHQPVLPTSNEPIVVTARITDFDGLEDVMLRYRSEADEGFNSTPMLDDGLADDLIGGDGIYTGTIPGAPSGTMRSFYITAFDGMEYSRFPALLDSTSEVPERTCLVRVDDSLLNTNFDNYRIWLSNDVINAFTSRPNLSNELLDCTFIYNDTEIFYNTRIRFRGSPFIRSGSGRDPRERYAYRIDFNPDQKFRGLEEINLDNTEGSNRGPLQERAAYWFYRKLGLQYSMQEYVYPIINGRSNGIYENVQKLDGDYIDAWFPDDNDGYLHKIDDYFEYNAEGTSFSNLDEGLKFDDDHPLLKETYRWGFEKRSHRENDYWDHLFYLAVAMNTPSSDPDYEQIIESVIDPEHFAKNLAIEHAVGNWDSYGYERGKNNYFYYAPDAGKWYLLPWDIDFAFGSGHGTSQDLFTVTSSEFPEVYQFLNYPKYRAIYLQAFADLVNGPWQTSYRTNNEPTEFDLFLDDAADSLVEDGLGDGRRNEIKSFVRSRREYILTQISNN